MKRALLYLWRHPRRTGFTIFNLVVVALLLVWGVSTNSMASEGLGGLPYLVLGYAGMGLALVVLVAGWIAWAVMVTSRHMPHAPPATPNPAPPAVEG